MAGMVLGLAASLCPPHVVHANDGAFTRDQALLFGYVERVLEVSDEALALHEDLLLAQDRVASEEEQFRTVIRPVANLAVDSSTRPRTGLEFSRQTRLGVDLSAGYATEGFGSGSSARSFARLGIPLFQRFGRGVTELGLAHAELQLQRSRLDVDRRQQQLIALAISNHITLVLAQSIRAQSEMALSRAVRNVAAANARQRVGLVSRIDVHRAELSRLDHLNAFERADYAAELKREEYAELAQLALADVHVAETLPQIGLPAFPEFMPEQRPEWHMQHLEQQAAKLELKSAERRMMPDLRFEVAWLGNQYGGQFDDYVDDGSDTFFSVRMDSDLNFIAKRRAIRVQKIAYERALRAGQLLERRLQRDVRQAEATLGSESKNLNLAEQQHREAQRARTVALARFERGIASNVDVLDAEAALSDAELGELGASAGHVSAIVQLALARGVLSLAWLQQSLATSGSEPGPPTREQNNE